MGHATCTVKLFLCVQPDEADEWLDVSVEACNCVQADADLERKAPLKSKPDVFVAAKPVEVLLHPCEAQEQVAVDIQIASEVNVLASLT